jgi:DNA (cytosine-5)-methyltransferase 1
MDSRPKAISLFSGCGGDTLGLENAGFNVVAFSEFKTAPINTHLANFPNSTLLKDSKDSTDISKIPDSVFEAYTDISVVFAGFPCQGFSSAGKRKLNDSRNQMFRQFVRVVKATKPHYFIGENVSGLLSMKSGPKPEDPIMLEVIRQAFSEIGYNLTYKVLEASDYGVPQSRKRLLIVGWKNNQPFDAEYFWASVASWGQQQPLKKMSSFIQQSLEGAHKLEEKAIPPNFDSVALQVTDNLEPTGTPHSYVTLKATTFDETYNEKTYDRLLSCGKRDSPIHSEVLNLNNPCKTIICTYDHQPRLLVGLKQTGTSYIRTLFPDELKQIQGFPATFKLTGNVKEQIVQVGNAVPPALVEGICRQLIVKLTPQAPPEVKKKVRVVKKSNQSS